MSLTRQETADALAAMLDTASLARLLKAVAAVKDYTGYGYVNLRFHQMKIIEAELNLTDKGSEIAKEKQMC